MSIAAIVPAYNEEKTIGKVLDVLKNTELLDEIIVVSDGSTDSTASIAKNYGVRLIELSRNLGKGDAVLAGVKNTDSDVILMIDADLIGLEKEHIHQLLEPVINGEEDMTIGIFKKGRGSTDLAQKVAPFLSGQRAIKKSLFDKLEKYNVKNYGIETALTIITNRENIKVREVFLMDLTHVMKEEKLGLAHGLFSRLKMYLEIVQCLIKLKREVF
jgi:glycosyltransferase involved in cell wall biosynthesis